jgi:hypothetical protein
MEGQEWIQLIREGGAVVVLVLLILGTFTRKWFVPGWVYREMEKQKDEWKEIAQQGSSVAKRTADTTGTSLVALQQAIDVVDAIRKGDTQ